jgi:hypothetical protein
MSYRVKVTESYFPHEDDATERKLAEFIIDELDIPQFLLAVAGATSVAERKRQQRDEADERRAAMRSGSEDGRFDTRPDPISAELSRQRAAALSKGTVHHYEDLPDSAPKLADDLFPR